ncbi:MAG: hypothetical protein RMJ56_08850 [Gemmataceae bacterium]|nr:hypothetical protein [Gemmata sp.]MDW8197694.1 hypothetical protein [Gemmataceae bacterium]
MSVKSRFFSPSAGPATLAGVIVLAAGMFALASAQPFAASWNDGSRLASIESLVERGTFCIDHSVFLHPPPDRCVYDPHNELLQKGTFDKLFIQGHWYSDKPPLVSLPLAAAYRLLMLGGVPAPSERPDVFAWIITIWLSGTGYASAVSMMWILGGRIGLSGKWRWMWLLAFAGATILPAYTRSANSHIAQLGAVAVVAVLLCRVADATNAGRRAWGALITVGFITSFIYNLDFGLGPPFALIVLAIVTLRTRNLWAVVSCAAAMLPGVVAGHALHAAIGGSWLKPLNMHREYLQWPGSPFVETMTGVVRPGYLAQLTYCLDLLVGRRGFLTHNLPLLLAVTAGWTVLKPTTSAAAARFSRAANGGAGSYRLELVALCVWCVVGWLMYGVLSTNHGGGCVSIRWFVPFLVPGFWLLAKLLVERPEFTADFLVLSAWGLILGASAWMVGMWWPRNVPLYWWCFGGALASWGVVRYCSYRLRKRLALAPSSAAKGQELPARAA